MPRKPAPTFEGKPCKVCGSATRYKSNTACVACAQARAAKPKHRAATKQWLRNTEEGREAVRRGNRVSYLKNREKHIARSTVKAYANKGKIPKATDCKCTDCGIQAEEYHHEDYSKPLDVIPLCKPCHLQRHVSQKVCI